MFFVIGIFLVLAVIVVIFKSGGRQKRHYKMIESRSAAQDAHAREIAVIAAKATIAGEDERVAVAKHLLAVEKKRVERQRREDARTNFLGIAALCFIAVIIIIGAINKYTGH